MANDGQGNESNPAYQLVQPNDIAVSAVYPGYFVGVVMLNKLLGDLNFI